MKTVFELILRRLMDNKTPHYIGRTVHALCLVTLSYGAANVFRYLDSIQSGMLTMLINDVFPKAIDSPLESLPLKQIIAGATLLLCETTSLFQNPLTHGALLRFILQMVDKESGWQDPTRADDPLEKDDDASREFDSTYSRLAFSQLPESEPSGPALKPAQFFVSTLAHASQASPGFVVAAAQSALDARQRTVLQALLTEARLSIA